MLSNSSSRFFTNAGEVISETHIRIAHLLHDSIKDPLPKGEIDFVNPNCVSSLVWYKNILNLVFRLSVPQQKKLAEKYASHCPQPVSSPSEVHFVFDQEEDFPSFESIPPFNSPVALSDAHCHLDLINNRTSSHLSLSEILQADDGQSLNNVFTSYCFPSASGDFPISSEVKNNNHVYICLGIHPKTSSKVNAHVINKFEEQLKGNEKVKAIGEIGLDFSTNVSKSSQIYVLRKMLHFALTYKLPVVIDCREGKTTEMLSCNRECIRVMREILPPNYPIYKHCLVSEQEAKLWVGAFPSTKFGINGKLFSHTSLQNFVKTANVEDLFTETDAPFLANNFNVKATLPRHVFRVAERISQLKQRPLSEIAPILNSTINKFYKV